MTSEEAIVNESVIEDAVTKVLAISPDDKCLCIAVEFPQNAPMALLESYRDNFEDFFAKADVKLPIIFLSGGVKINLLKIPKEYLQEI